MSDVQVVVDLLNTRDLRTHHGAANVMERDRLGSPAAARGWLADQGLLEAGCEIGEDEWDLVLRLRDALRAAVESRRPDDTRALEDFPVHLAVRLDGTGRPTLGHAGGGAGAALAGILAAAVTASIDGTWERLKTCAADDCRRAFYDRSRNRSARWCSSQGCGNRVRTRSYRRRQPGDPESAVTQRVVRRPTARQRANVFRLEGEIWRIAYAGHGFRLGDSKGLRQLARLLADPGREWHVLDLVAVEAGADAGRRSAMPDELQSATHGGDAGVMLDERAKEAYRLRVEDLRNAVAEGRLWGDPERVARAEEELSAVAAELARAVGLGGRDRRAASDAERARINVTRTIKAALVRIAEHNAELGHHLGSTVRTGTYCAYDPDPRLLVDWQL